MKTVLVAVCFVAGLVPGLVAQSHDLCIAYQRYRVGVPVVDDTIRFNFVVKNAGNTTLPAGTVVNLGVDIGGIAYDLDLLGPPPTGHTLAQNLAPGDSVTFSKGYLLGSGTLLFLGVSEVDFCLIVYGTGADPVNTTFPNDAEPANNTDCVRFTSGAFTRQARLADCSPPAYDLCISYLDYTEGEPVDSDSIWFNFAVKNNGSTTVPSGTDLNLGVEIAGNAFDLALLGPPPSKVTLTRALAPADTILLRSGYLLGPETLAFLSLTEGDFCLKIYGTGTDPSDGSFPNDPLTANNTHCVRYAAGIISLQSRAAQCVVETPTSVQRQARHHAISCFPNPASTVLQLQNPLGKPATLTLKNTQGKEVYSAVVLPGKNMLVIAHLPRGVYLADLASQGEPGVHFRLLLQ